MIKDYGFCKVCGKPLKQNQKNCCSYDCKIEYNRNLKPAITKICPTCKKQFETKANSRIYCCRKCSDDKSSKTVIKIDSRNRPYTIETAYLIRLWHSQGDSVEAIANILSRSVENVKLAL